MGSSSRHTPGRGGACPYSHPLHTYPTHAGLAITLVPMILVLMALPKNGMESEGTEEKGVGSRPQDKIMGAAWIH